MTTSNEHNNAPAVPQGWKLVPVEPTRAMWAAVNKLDDEMAAGSYDGKGCSIEQAWNCMLDFAPDAPALAATPAPAPAQEVASAFTTALDIRLAQGWNLTGNAIPVLYTDTINDYQVRRDDVWLCTTDALKTKQEVGLTASQFDLICQAIVALDTGTITMEGNYMLDSDDCIAVVRVMQALFDIKALRAKGQT